MDETAIAFELPHARAAATDGGPPLDRISVRDYTRQVEIGAFRTERGVTQRIRFNVVLEVAHHAAAADDDVDKVISYDTITEAIEEEIAAERINLLETLAERVAARVLADPRAVRVFVRLEKLDRIPGALGVEIVRSRPPEAAPRLRAARPARRGRTGGARVVYLAPERRGPTPAWRDALAALGGPARALPRAAAPQPPAATEAQRRIGLLAIEQAAWAFADADPRFAVAGSRTELDWALKAGRLAVWAPTHMATAALGPGRCPTPAIRPASPPGSRGEIGAGLRRRRCAAAGARSRPSPPTSAALQEEEPHERRLAADRPVRLAGPGLPARRHQGQGLDARHRCAGRRGCVMFICNHCPYVQAIVDKLVREGKALHDLGFGVAAICSNDAAAIPRTATRRWARSRGGTISRSPTCTTSPSRWRAPTAPPAPRTSSASTPS